MSDLPAAAQDLAALAACVQKSLRDFEELSKRFAADPEVQSMHPRLRNALAESLFIEPVRKASEQLADLMVKIEAAHPYVIPANDPSAVPE